MRGVIFSAPWRRALFLFVRWPSVGVAIGITALLLGLAAAAAPLYVTSVGSAAVTLQIGQQCRTSLGNAASGGGPVAQAGQAVRVLDQESQTDLSRAGAPSDGVGPSVVTMASGVAMQPATTAAPRIQAQLVTRSGALSHIHISSEQPGRGVFVSEDVAQLFGLRTGDFIRLTASHPSATTRTVHSSTRVRVRGIYQPLVGTVLPAYWCSLTQIFGTPDSAAPPPPVVLADAATFRSILTSLEQPTIPFFRWEQPVNTDVTLRSAQSVAAAETTLSHWINTPSSGASSPGREVARGFSVSDGVPLQYSFLTKHAQATQSAVSAGIVPLAIASVLVAFLLISAAGVYWVDKRRLELQLLLSRGVGLGSLGFKASLESAIPVTLGTVAGWSSAVALVEAFGPSTQLDARYVEMALLLALCAAFAALLSMGLVAAVRLQRTTSASRPGVGLSNGRRVVVELILLALTVTAWRSLGYPTLEAGSTSAQPIGVSFFLFPLLFLVCAVSIATHVLLVLLRGRWPRTLTRSTAFPIWLSVRRITRTPNIAAVVVASIAATSGIYCFAAIVRSSQAQTLHAKAETFAGADVSANIGNVLALPKPLSASATVVLRETNGATVGSTLVDVLGVDPQTFARGAFWDRSYSRSSLSELMHLLSGPATVAGPLPVIVVGDSDLSLREGLTFPGRFVANRIRRVATATYFPGQDGSTPLVVVDRQSLGDLDFSAQPQVWAHGSESSVLNALNEAGIRTPIVVTSANVLNLTEFASIGWTFAYLESLSVVMGAGVAFGLVLFLTARNRARALSYALSRRMGLSRGGSWLTTGTEVGALLVAGLGLGIGFGWILAGILDHHLNPLPSLPPATLTSVPWSLFGIGLVATLLVWITISTWTQTVADRSKAAELMRTDA